jgi:hypothetical protein
LALDPDNQTAREGLAELLPAMASQDLDTLDPYQFEDLIARLLEKMGLDVEETKRSGDGGVDVIAHSDEPITGGLFVIQCKKYSSKVGVPKVRDLYGVVHHLNASKGILITNADFTQQAKDFAEGKPIELIDGDALRTLLDRHSIACTLPEGMRRAVVDERQLQYFRGLLRIADDIDAELTRLEVDNRLASRAAVVLGIEELVGAWRRLMGKWDGVFDDFKMMTTDWVGETRTLSKGDVDYRLKAVEAMFEKVMEGLRPLALARVKDGLGDLKQDMVEYVSALLADFTRIMRG